MFLTGTFVCLSLKYKELSHDLISKTVFVNLYEKTTFQFRNNPKKSI